jgi:CubicO group peptidase (beta-lactamase class C family)
MTALLLLVLQDAEFDRRIAEILEADRIPGAVIVYGTKDRIAFRRAFGTAKLDTIFDLASCTKVVATTTAAMKLVDDGALSLDDRVDRFTVRELLTHRTGLPAYLTPKTKEPEAILREIAALAADGKFRYS